MHAKAAQHPAHATCVVATTLQHTKLTQELTAIHTGQNKQWKEGRIAESGLNPDKAKGASERVRRGPIAQDPTYLEPGSPCRGDGCMWGFEGACTCPAMAAFNGLCPGMVGVSGLGPCRTQADGLWACTPLMGLWACRTG